MIPGAPLRALKSVVYAVTKEMSESGAKAPERADAKEGGRA